MRIEVVAIGNEILDGFTLNTNASYISQQILGEGLKVSKHSVISDEKELLVEAIGESIERSDLVITTGGLGPTGDDITRSAVAELYGAKFVVSDQVMEDLTKRFGKELPSLQDQSTVPEGAEVLINSLGTAPGLLFEGETCSLVVLPGVPYEMKRMVEDHLLPFIQRKFQTDQKRFYKKIDLFGVTESMVDPVLRGIGERDPLFQYGIYPALGLLSVRFYCSAGSELEADRVFAPWVEVIEGEFGEQFLDSPDGTVQGAVHSLFIEKGITLSCAESCSGGAIASRLVSLPGASDYFLGSIVSYSNQMKKEILGVQENTLKQFGAVSRETAEEMALGALERCGSDYSLSVTGVAGPEGGTDEKPVGTVWAAIAKRGDREEEESKVLLSWKLKKMRGSRAMIIEKTVNLSLAHLWRVVSQ